MENGALNRSKIAIVGMAGRFPGARNVDAFWENIKAAVETVTPFPPEEMEVAPSREEDEDATLVCAKGLLDDVDMFDAQFFGYLPREAEGLDPQHRIFLEICSDALENAGCDPSRHEGAIGVFGGCYMDTYILSRLSSDAAFREKVLSSIQVGSLETEIGSDKDYFATRVAYKLGLTGPAMTIQTACSTSLVAVATACRHIETGACDMALAGGVSVVLPQKKGYYYKPGGMLSPDGHCRPLDAGASGTVFSNGAGVVVLKRLDAALADGDTIYAVIRGYATNNDASTGSFAAPNPDGQSAVVAAAIDKAGVDARTIGYLESHGTATPTGEPVEVAALTRTFKRYTDEKQFCAIGSVKANIGHLDVASGVTGLIKAALVLHHKTLPAQANFTTVNPKIDIESTPFFVNTETRPWDETDHIRRAGVSSFGVGGTNAHVVAEEGPAAPVATDVDGRELLILSAKSETALQQQAAQLADYLEAHPEIRLADAAHTLRMGRRNFAHRRIVVARDRADAVSKLRSQAKPVDKSTVAGERPEVIFMFPGQGAQYPGMGRALYEDQPVFKKTVDRVAEILLDSQPMARDIRQFILWSEDSGQAREEIAVELADTANAQPALYAVECAFAALLQSWGITPAGVIGHSIGEFAAAISAGVFSIEDGARIVAARGRAMQAQPPGQMLAVMAEANEIAERLTENLSLAADNATGACVVSGAHEHIAKFKKMMESEGVATTILKTSHAFHSAMMGGARADLEKVAGSIVHGDPQTKFYSTLKGDSLSGPRALNGAYWGEQLMAPVRFRDAVCAAAKGPLRIFLELGPGQTLSGFVRRTLGADVKALSALGPVSEPGDEHEALLSLAGRIWANGAAPDWSALATRPCRRIPLPTYPYERKRFWFRTDDKAQSSGTEIAVPKANAKITKEKGAGAIDGAVRQVIDHQLDVIAGQLALLKKQ